MSGTPWLWFQPVDGGRWHMVGDTRRVDPSPVEIHGRYRYEMRGQCSRSNEWGERPPDDRVTTTPYLNVADCCRWCVRTLDRMVEHLIQVRDDLHAAPRSERED
jgi:hypothetical protein